MKKIKHKKMLIACVIIMCLSVLALTGKMQYIVARISSSIYIANNYPTRSFKFERAEYLYGFGTYGVVYKDKNGSTEGLGLQMYPKDFPVFIIYDSIKKHG